MRHEKTHFGLKTLPCYFVVMFFYLWFITCKCLCCPSTEKIGIDTNQISVFVEMIIFTGQIVWLFAGFFMALLRELFFSNVQAGGQKKRAWRKGKRQQACF